MFLFLSPFYLFIFFLISFQLLLPGVSQLVETTAALLAGDSLGINNKQHGKRRVAGSIFHPIMRQLQVSEEEKSPLHA